MSELTATRLQEVLHYDPETGVFRWRISFGRWGKTLAGSIAGGPRGNGYHRIKIDGRSYSTHRLVWLWVKGEWPRDQIDHVNMDRADNRFANLREATASRNKANMRALPTNTSGAKGVYWFKRDRKWRAMATVRGRRFRVGQFDDPHVAGLMYAAFVYGAFGEFARSELMAEMLGILRPGAS
jgi:HNH endonuclease